jgi:Zn-dependent protease
MQGFDIVGFLQQLPIYLIPGLFAITVHEVAHGWVAKRCGDPTALFAGRLTLNPFKHIDPVGTVVVPLGLLLMTGGRIAFGWAKPVPVAFGNLNNPRRDMILVAAAGPASNLMMAMGWAAIGGTALAFAGFGTLVGDWLIGMSVFGININVILAVFNMLPLPPLDGGRVLAGLLPPRASRVLDGLEPYGFMIVLLLMFIPAQTFGLAGGGGVLWVILEPLRFFFIDFFWGVAGFG